MKIYNPSNKAIKDVKLYGVLYSIEAEGTLENVPEEHARLWQGLHAFLQLRKDKLEAKPIEEVVEIPTPKIEEVVESTLTIETEPSTVVIDTPVMETPTEVVEEEVTEEAPTVVEKPKKVKKVK